MGDDSVIFQGISITPEFAGKTKATPTFNGVSITPEFAGKTEVTPTFNGISITSPYFIYPSSVSISKKVYMTDKGNIVVNPNDTILIEL